MLRRLIRTSTVQLGAHGGRFTAGHFLHSAKSRPLGAILAALLALACGRGLASSHLELQLASFRLLLAPVLRQLSPIGRRVSAGQLPVSVFGESVLETRVC